MISIEVQTDCEFFLWWKIFKFDVYLFILIVDIIERWGSLKTRAELHTARQLQKDMAMLKDELNALAARVQAMETNVTSREELDEKIAQLKVS